MSRADAFALAMVQEEADKEADQIAYQVAMAEAQLESARTKRADSILRLRELEYTWKEISTIYGLSMKRPIEIAHAREHELRKAKLVEAENRFTSD